MNMKHYVKPETTSLPISTKNTLCASAKIGVELGTMKVKSFHTPLIALLLGGLMMVSCQNGNSDINPTTPAFKQGEEVIITTSSLGSSNKAPRRVHIGSESGGLAQMVWTGSDQLRVIVQQSETPASFVSSDFNLIDGENTNLGTFRGTMPADGSEFFLAYPCGNIAGSGWNESTHTFTFQSVSVPNVQDFTVGASTFNPGLMPVVGYGKDDNGTLTGTTTIVGGALRVKLTNNTGKDLTFNKVRLYVHDSHVSEEGINTSVWASSYTVNYNVESGEVTPSGTSADNNNIVLNLSDKVTLAKEATSDYFYFVMVAPLYFKTKVIGGGDASSFTVYLYNYDGEVTATSDLISQTPVATTSFNYNIAIAPGDIVEGTLVMTNEE